jgi:aromatic ring hydroxylase
MPISSEVIVSNIMPKAGSSDFHCILWKNFHIVKIDDNTFDVEFVASPDTGGLVLQCGDHTETKVTFAESALHRNESQWTFIS